MDRFNAGGAAQVVLAASAAPLGASSAAALFGFCTWAMAKLTNTVTGPLAEGLTIVDSLFIMFVGVILFHVWFYVFGLLAVTIVGIPMHALLTALRRTGWISYAGTGALVGLLSWYVLGFADPRQCGDTSNPCWEDLSWSSQLSRILFWGVFPGAGGGLTFWVVLRPDHAATKTPESAAAGKV